MSAAVSASLWPIERIGEALTMLAGASDLLSSCSWLLRPSERPLSRAPPRFVRRSPSDRDRTAAD